MRFLSHIRNKVFGIIFVELVAQKLDRAFWRELQRIYGRRLTYDEKWWLLMSRFAEEESQKIRGIQ